MIETSVKIHDKFSFEFKISFISDTNTEEDSNEFSINSWLFVPNSLDINKETYPKEQFFKDVKSNIRLMTPVFSMRKISSDEPGSPKRRLKESLNKVLEDPASDERGDQFTHEAKMFANICKSSIRDQANRIIHLPDNEIEDSCVKFVDDAQLILHTYRNLYPLVQRKELSDEWKEIFAFGDNFISNVIEQHAFRLMQELEPREKFENIRKILFPLVHKEAAERKKKRFPNLEKDDLKNNDWVVMQWGILKKLIENVLFLHIKSGKDGAFAEQVYYGIAAGVSMLFATIVTFTAQQHYESFTLPLFLIIVVSYMFKDRIKDLMRYYFSSQLGKKYFDKKRKLITRNIEIGVMKESAEYVSENKLPEEVISLRKRTPIVEAENKIDNEQIILYKKLVKLSPAQIATLKGYHFEGINDVTKFHLIHFTQKMSDSKMELHLPDESRGYTSFVGDKMYSLHFVFRGESNRKVFYRKYRLLFNREGIKELVEI
jgi:hypothetical protein